MSTEELAALIDRLSELEARELTDEIKAKQTEMWVLLGRAYSGRAWEALGYPKGAKGWAAYCEQEFGQVEQYSLKREPRRAVLRVWMTEHGMTQGAAAVALRTSRPLITDDVKVLREAGELTGLKGTSMGLDGRERSTTAKPTGTVRATVPEGLSSVEEAAWWAGAKGANGITSKELDKPTGWGDRPGKSSGSLSKAKKRGLVKESDMRRGNRVAYVVVN